MAEEIPVEEFDNDNEKFDCHAEFCEKFRNEGKPETKKGHEQWL